MRTVIEKYQKRIDALQEALGEVDGTQKEIGRIVEQVDRYKEFISDLEHLGDYKTKETLYNEFADAEAKLRGYSCWVQFNEEGDIEEYLISKVKVLEKVLDAYTKPEDWIDVLDRSPVEGDRVLCFGIGDRMFTAIYAFGEFMDNDGDSGERITHWRPLPANPNSI